MKITYKYSREALKEESYDKVILKKSGKPPVKRKQESVAAVLRKLQLSNK